MRKLVAGLFISLDGVTQDPFVWQETFDEDMGAQLKSMISQIDTILLGRVTYQEWAAYWTTTTSDESYAKFINQTPKYVASTTLDHVEWGQFDTATLIKGNLADEINKLKEQSGKTISVQGSPTLVNWLLQNDLLDELQLYVHNVVAAKGTRLFKDGGNMKRLTLIDSKITRSGVAMLTYQPRKD